MLVLSVYLLGLHKIDVILLVSTLQSLKVHNEPPMGRQTDDVLVVWETLDDNKGLGLECLHFM